MRWSRPTWQITPALRILLGLETSAESDRARLFAAWRLLLERMSEKAPVILVFKDAHWADQALLDFLEYLCSWSRDHRLFVTVLTRPELSDVRPGWGRSLRSQTVMTLEPLAATEMAELIAALAPGLPDETARRIVEHADGVPLYAVETVRMLLDRGLLERHGDRFRAVADVGELQIPLTLHALIAARLDTLPEAERRALQQASVLGKSFTTDGLVALSDTPCESVEELLRTLVDRELLRREADPFSAERGQRVFVQSMTRAIAYDTLARRDRKALHLAAAAHLTSLTEREEIVEVIAAHWLDAYTLLPDADDAPQVRAVALEWLDRAAAHAAAIGAPSEAQRIVERMLELTADPAERARLLIWAGDHANAADRPERAEQLLAEALEIHQAAGDAHRAAGVQVQLAATRWIIGHADQSIADMEQAYAILADDDQNRTLAELAAELARVRRFLHRAEDAEEPLERALTIAAALDLPDIMAEALNTKGTLLLAVTGRTREGRALVEGALAIARERGQHRSELRALFNLGYFEEISDTPTGTPDRDGPRWHGGWETSGTRGCS